MALTLETNTFVFPTCKPASAAKERDFLKKYGQVNNDIALNLIIK